LADWIYPAKVKIRFVSPIYYFIKTYINGNLIPKRSLSIFLILRTGRASPQPFPSPLPAPSCPPARWRRESRSWTSTTFIINYQALTDIPSYLSTGQRNNRGAHLHFGHFWWAAAGWEGETVFLFVEIYWEREEFRDVFKKIPFSC
jgi:hypothetical protein